MNAALAFSLPARRASRIPDDGPGVWTQSATGSWSRTCHGHQLEVHRAHGGWYRAQDGVQAPRAYPSQMRAMEAARVAASPRVRPRREFGVWHERRAP